MRKFLTTAQRAPYRATLGAVQTALMLDIATMILFTHARIGGLRMKSLRKFLFASANGNCVCCRQVTRLDVSADSVDAATCGILIPCALIADTKVRAGYLPGNAANFCRACCNLANDSTSGMALWIWTADIIDAECVPTVWPALSKDRTKTDKVASTVDPITHIRECQRVMAARGIVPMR